MLLFQLPSPGIADNFNEMMNTSMAPNVSLQVTFPTYAPEDTQEVMCSLITFFCQKPIINSIIALFLVVGNSNTISLKNYELLPILPNFYKINKKN